MSSLLLLLLVPALALSEVNKIKIDSSSGIQQVHIAYGENPLTDMTIMWSTAAESNSIVNYGTTSGLYTNSVKGEHWQFTVGNPKGLQWMHRVRLTGLKPGQKYYYKPQSGSLMGDEYSFTTMTPGNDWDVRLLVYGDMGKTGGSPTVPRLIGEVESGWPHAVLHVGDFAYDFDSDGGVNGDEFMERIVPIAANIPYMTAVGNHETPFNFSHYINRFTMPGWDLTKNMWYSFDMSMIHFVVYSTEAYFDKQGGNVTDQMAWLQEDLKQANARRHITPWVIALGHRPMYCSNDDGDDCTTPRSIIRKALEGVFYDAGVDLIIEAHEHSYERLWPVWNETVTQFNYEEPRAPVHIISGAAGCNEDSGICVNAIIHSHGPWSAYWSWFPGKYGYGRLHAYNATHLHWEQIYDLTGWVEDEITIVQHYHGPFASRP